MLGTKDQSAAFAQTSAALATRAGASLVALLVAVMPAVGQDSFTRPVPGPLPADNAQFGTALALGDGVLVVGAQGDSVRGARAGVIYTYQRDAATGELVVDQSLVPTSVLPFDRFGGAVALDGDLLAVGATGDDGAAPNAGAVYLFTRPGAGLPFTLLAELTPPPLAAGVSDRFGASVAVEAGRVAVGAPLDDGVALDAGAVYVYDVDPVLGQVTAAGEVRDPVGKVGDNLGWSVALDGDRVLVGAPRYDIAGGARDAGGVLVFEEAAAGTWILLETLTSSRPRRDGDFGFALAIDPAVGAGRGTLVVGEPLAAPSGASAGRGAVHIFEAFAGAAWAHVSDYGYSDGRSGLRRGERVAVSDDVVVASIPDLTVDVDGVDVQAIGGAQVVRRSPTGAWNFSAEVRLPGFEAYERAGLGLVYDGEALVLGAPGRAAAGFSNVGRVWTSSAAWARLGSVECVPAEPNSTGTFASLAASGSFLAASNNLTLEAGFIPPGEFVLPLVGSAPAFFANPGGSQGNLCLGVSIGRFLSALGAADANGRVSVPVDLTLLPQPTGPVVVTAGQTWYFQVWYRDRNPVVTSNYTTSLAVPFR